MSRERSSDKSSFESHAEWSFLEEAGRPENVRSKPPSSSSRHRGEERKERQHAKFGGNERCVQGLEEQERPKLVVLGGKRLQGTGGAGSAGQYRGTDPLSEFIHGAHSRTGGKSPGGKQPQQHAQPSLMQAQQPPPRYAHHQHPQPPSDLLSHVAPSLFAALHTHPLHPPNPLHFSAHDPRLAPPRPDPRDPRDPRDPARLLLHPNPSTSHGGMLRWEGEGSGAESKEGEGEGEREERVLRGRFMQDLLFDTLLAE